MAKLKFILLSLALTSMLAAEDTKISSDTHFHYSVKDKDKQGFELSRAYFTFEKSVDDNISYKFQTDVGSGGPTDFSVYLKNANLAWKTDAGKLVFGLQGMNMFNIQEGNWGYRFIEKSAMDKYKYSSSADMGISWEKSFGVITPHIMISNGTGYKKVEDDQYKKVSLRLLYGKAKLKQGLNAGVAISMESEDYINTAGDILKGGTQVYGVFTAYATGPLKVGAEYAMQTESLASDKSSNLLSVYGNYKISKKLAGFGRFDMVEPDADKVDDKESALILGVTYQPEKGFYIAPNVKMTMPEKGDNTTVYQLSFRFNI